MGDQEKKATAKQALQTVSDEVKPEPSPQRVELSEGQFFKLKSGRLEMANAMGQFTMAKRELEIAGKALSDAQTKAGKFEDKLSKELGLPEGTTLRTYELDEESMTAVLPDRQQRAMAQAARGAAPRE